MAIDPIGAAAGASSATAGGELPGFAGGWEGGEPEPPARARERIERELADLEARGIGEEGTEGEREERSRRRQGLIDWLARLEARSAEDAAGKEGAPAGPLGTRFDESA